MRNFVSRILPFLLLVFLPYGALQHPLQLIRPSPALPRRPP